MNFLKKNTFGLLLCIVIAGIATFMGGLSIGGFSLEVIGAPVFAILIGMIITLLMPNLATDDKMKDGVKFLT